MSNETPVILLKGRLFIETRIETVTGLLIGGNDTGLEIGGVDKVCIRNPLTNQPYIPGSSLRGKIRSQLEKKLGLEQNYPIGQNVRIHSVVKRKDGTLSPYTDVCHIFGVSGDVAQRPTLLLVRDVALAQTSAEDLKQVHFAEIKTEVAIDRVTSQATPRTLERVPAGAIFGPAELVFNIYEAADYDRLKLVIEGLQLVEDDYLGGAGSRGSGKVKFQSIRVSARSSKDYAKAQSYDKEFGKVQEMLDGFDGLKQWAQKTIEASAN